MSTTTPTKGIVSFLRHQNYKEPPFEYNRIPAIPNCPTKNKPKQQFWWINGKIQSNIGGTTLSSKSWPWLLRSVCTMQTDVEKKLIEESQLNIFFKLFRSTNLMELKEAIGFVSVIMSTYKDNIQLATKYG